MWRKRKTRTAQELDPKNIAALIEASHISEEEIRKWHVDFLEQYPSGLLDKTKFIEYCQKLNPDGSMHDTFAKSFETIDVNGDGTVDFNELLAVIIVTSRLQEIELRLAFVFDIWDQSGDGNIDKEELVDAITIIYDCTGVTDRKGEREPNKRAKDILSKFDSSGNKKISKEEFITGCKNDPVIRDLLAPNI